MRDNIEATYSYLCDAKKPCHVSGGCFINGGECSHTLDKEHAKNRSHPENMRFIMTHYQGWEEI